MALTKNDLKQIRSIVKEEVSTEVGHEVGNLALITKRGFDENGKVHRLMNQKNQEEHTQIKKDTSGIHYIATEMVKRDEFLALRQRVEKLEAKIAALK
jgi:hemoglobin-like flavoprotein